MIGTNGINNQSDSVNHPQHYTYGSIESIDYIKSCGWLIPFCLGNALKYISRCEHKGNTLEDLKKARWYIDKAIMELEERNT